MIISKIKIWHFLLMLFVLLIVLRFDLLIGLVELYLKFIGLLFKDSKSLFAQIDFRFIDNFISLALIFIIPFILFFSKRIKKLVKLPLNLSGLIIILLSTSFIFAPIITNQHPEFQKNISVTKLLPPLSKEKFIELKAAISNSQTDLDNFAMLKKSVIPESFNDRLIFIDSLRLSSGSSASSSTKDIDASIVEYFQNDVMKKLPLFDVVKIDSKPIIREKYFILGSDEYGRDIFTRIIYGSRISVLVGIGSVLLSLLIGIGMAFIATQKVGIADLILSRVTDLFLSFPAIFLVIMILALFGSNLISVIIVLGLSGWMSLFKIVKSEISSIKKKDYFLSAELIGLRNIKLLIREILPVIIAPVIVNLVFQFTNVILAESALSYLGLGTGISYPSWGAMIESGQEYITQSWWMIFIPGIVLIITLLSINSVGKKINEFYNSKFQV